MKKFTVSVCRIAYGFHDIDVEAETAEQAKEIALDVAGNYIFSEKSSDYEVEGVYLKD